MPGKEAVSQFFKLCFFKMKSHMNNFSMLIKEHCILKRGKFQGIVYNLQIFMSPLLKIFKKQIIRCEEMSLLGGGTM